MSFAAFDKIEALTLRRFYLTRNAPICPKCSTPQVQLTDMYQNPAEWKCRMCKTRFTFEPPGVGA